MEISKDQLLTSIHCVHYSKISLPDLYLKKCGGYKNEKEIEDLLNSRGYETVDGGQILFVEKTEQSYENTMIYYTVSTDDPEKYFELYKNISKIPGMKRLFFVKINDEWNIEKIKTKNIKEKIIDFDILKPAMNVFEFSVSGWKDSDFQQIKQNMKKKKAIICKYKDPRRLDYLKDYDLDYLIKIYCNRYVLEIELDEYKKNMMDFDSMIFHEGNYVAIESKEKDPIGKWIKKKVKGVEKELIEEDQKKWAFGWDTRRFAWYRFLNHTTEITTWYLIREIDHQKTRNFVKWKIIELEKFANCAVWHFERQTGRGSTIEVSYPAFDDF